MVINETGLQQQLKEGPRGLYVLYGEESYLTEHYARLIARRTVDEAFDAFNLQRFDGQSVTPEQLEEAVEALPLMAEKKCVLVRDLDVASADGERLLALVSNLPDSCVLVFWQMTLQPDKKKAWQSFLKQAEQTGTVVCFARKSVGDVVKLLVKGAARRGCTLAPEDARYLVEQAGNDLTLLFQELDKLAALAGEGAITRQSIDQAVSKNLEARVFDLSKAILNRRGEQAFDLLHQLTVQREEPLAILGALSTAYADWYRAKAAATGGVSAETLADSFKSYKGKEFRLRNAARDAARIRVEALRDSLEILAAADRALKSGRGDDRVRLEQTVARLIARAQEN